MPAVLITGGTGLIGTTLTKHLTAKGYEVILLSRKKIMPAENKLISYATWNIEKQQIDTAAIIKADYIIHLAGANVMEKRWSENFKKKIVESRTETSKLLIKTLSEVPNQLKAVISASAIGWYGNDHSKKEKIKQDFIETDPPDKTFLGETCKLWEESIEPITQLNKRLVKLRTGIVLSNDGGAFAEFKKPLKYGIAAILGNGKQIISWIHIDDLCRMYIYAIENENMHGSYNAVAPSPVKNKLFTLKLAEIMRGKFYIPVHVPQFLLKLILGERSIEILKSATVSCVKIKGEGFTFLYPSIDTALKQLIRK